MPLWRHTPRVVRNSNAHKQPSKPPECFLQRWRAQEGLWIILRVLLDFRVFFFQTDLKVGLFSGSVKGGRNTDGVKQLLPLIFRQQRYLILGKFWSSVSWLPTVLKVLFVLLLLLFYLSWKKTLFVLGSLPCPFRTSRTAPWCWQLWWPSAYWSTMSCSGTFTFPQWQHSQSVHPWNRRKVHRHVLVVLLNVTVLTDIVEIVPADNNGPASSSWSWHQTGFGLGWRH